MTDNSISYIVSKHSSLNTVQSLIDIINLHEINNKESLNMEINQYRLLASKIQDEINKKEYNKKIINEILSDLINYMKTDKFLVQSNIYLRCSRPNNNKISNDSESIGFHRESFYGPNMEKSINIWTPILGVNKDNTLRFIPNSHLIPDNEIIVEKNEDKFTKRYSDGHKLGFQYAAKKIISGVNLDNNLPMNVPNFSSSIFPGNLIHGSAINNSNTIRFSCDFRVIRKKDYSTDSKKFHFASNKPYFVEYDIN